jgi:hypothetical protein
VSLTNINPTPTNDVFILLTTTSSSNSYILSTPSLHISYLPPGYPCIRYCNIQYTQKEADTGTKVQVLVFKGGERNDGSVTKGANQLDIIKSSKDEFSEGVEGQVLACVYVDVPPPLVFIED